MKTKKTLLSHTMLERRCSILKHLLHFPPRENKTAIDSLGCRLFSVHTSLKIKYRPVFHLHQMGTSNLMGILAHQIAIHLLFTEWYL
jgi:hypothetical protein